MTGFESAFRELAPPIGRVRNATIVDEPIAWPKWRQPVGVR
jgi:hypothetical protein